MLGLFCLSQSNQFLFFLHATKTYPMKPLCNTLSTRCKNFSQMVKFTLLPNIMLTFDKDPLLLCKGGRAIYFLKKNKIVNSRSNKWWKFHSGFKVGDQNTKATDNRARNFSLLLSMDFWPIFLLQTSCVTVKWWGIEICWKQNFILNVIATFETGFCPKIVSTLWKGGWKLVNEYMHV